MPACPATIFFRFYWLFAFVCILTDVPVQAQPARIRALDLTTFHERKTAATLIQETDGPEVHPDYGFLPYRDIPCSDCQELLQRRSADSREFVRRGSSGIVHLVQYAAGAINYLDASGFWREIDSRLRPLHDGSFTADRQPFPVSIDPASRSTSITINGKTIRFNRNIRLVHKADDGFEKELGDIDWSGIQAGDDGAVILNAYPGIDLVFQVRRGTLESGFLLHGRPQLDGGTLCLRFDTELPNGCSMNAGSAEAPYAPYEFLDASGQSLCRLLPCFAFDDAYPEQSLALTAKYRQGTFEIAVPVFWLNDPARIYPVLIDPVVTTQGVLTDGVGGVEGTRYSPVCWTNGCDYQLVVPTPANSRLTNVYTSFEYYAATGRCQAQDGGYSVSLNGCTAPSAAPGVFTCASPLSNFYCGSSNLDITADLAGCLPIDQCASQNLTFTLHFYRCNNDPDVSCSASCISASQPWTITLEGRDLELPFVSSIQPVCQGTTAQVVAVADYGIGPYAFSWSPVASSDDTLTVTPNSTTSYTVTVTDACGTQRTGIGTVDVVAIVNPGFGASDTVSCTGSPIQLTGYGGGSSASYDWVLPGSNAPGGIVNDDPAPAVAYSLPGTFPVTLRYSSGSCSADSTIDIVVRSPQPAEVGLVASPSGVICPGDAVTFTASDISGGGILSYTFLLNGSIVLSGVGDSFTSSSLQNGDIVQVVMSSSGDCVLPAIDTASLFIAVSGSVTPAVQIVATDVCAGVPLLLTASPVNGGTLPVYQWSVNGNPVPGVTGPVWSTTLASGDTVVSVQMVSSLGCVTVPVAVDAVVVNPSSPSQVSIVSDVGTVLCPGEVVTVTATPFNGGSAPVYSWYLNGLPTGDTGQVFISSALLSGDRLTVEMTSSSPCAAPPVANSTSLDFQVAPPLAFLVFGSPPVCEGESVTLSAGVVTGDGGPYSFAWDGVAGSDSYTFQPTATRFVTVEVEDGCSTVPVRDSSLVIVHPAPQAGFAFDPFSPSTMDPVVQFTDTSSGASRMTWYFGDGDSSISRNPAHQYLVPGSYQVSQVVLSPNGCYDTMTYVVIYREDVRIWFPNSFTPNGDLSNDTWSPVGIGLGDYKFTIWDRWGGLLFEGDQDTPWPGTYKDTESMVQQGVYTWVVELDKGKFEDNKLAGVVTLIRVFR